MLAQCDPAYDAGYFVAVAVVALEVTTTKQLLDLKDSCRSVEAY